jgi:uncharacterized protein YggE
MESRSILAGAAVVAALLVTAGIGGAITTGAAPANVEAQNQDLTSDTITVSGSGTVQADADRAVVSVAVLSSGDDISAVREDLSENASEMRDALAEMGIDENLIRTAYFDISSEERYGRQDPEAPTYRGMHAFEITIETPDDAGQVIDTAVSNGASEVDGVEFTLSPDRREELREQALESAMNNARSEASTVAGAEDLSITGVDRISTTDYRRTPYAVETAAGGDAGARTSISSGPVTVRASVSVVYDTS